MTPQEFGDLIRKQREGRGLTIEALAARFKLSVSTLRSIEDGSLENMPHAVYARGFVRSYAQAVGVKADDLEKGIDALFPQHLFEDIPTPPAPVSGNIAKQGKSLTDKLVALLIVFLVVGVPLGLGWFVYEKYGDDIAALVKKTFSAMPSSSAPAAEMPVASRLAEPAPAPSAVPRPVEAAPQAAPREEARAEAAAPVQEPPAAPREEPVASIPLEGKSVGLQATEECWVEVIVDGGGTRSFTIYPGEISILPYKRKMTVVLGNAGGVKMTHNNAPYALNAKRNEKRTLTFQ